MDLCTPQGTIERRIPSKGKLKMYPGAYRAARKSEWGGLWPDWLSRGKKTLISSVFVYKEPKPRKNRKDKRGKGDVDGDDGDVGKHVTRIDQDKLAGSRGGATDAMHFSEDDGDDENDVEVSPELMQMLQREGDGDGDVVDADDNDELDLAPRTPLSASKAGKSKGKKQGKGVAQDRGRGGDLEEDSAAIGDDFDFMSASGKRGGGKQLENAKNAEYRDVRVSGKGKAAAFGSRREDFGDALHGGDGEWTPVAHPAPEVPRRQTARKTDQKQSVAPSPARRSGGGRPGRPTRQVRSPGDV